MKKHLVVLIAICAILVLSCDPKQHYDPAAKFATGMPLVEANNAFAAKLYTELAKRDSGNLFFSPMSISTALAMAYAGARGETAAEMAKAMNIENVPDVHSSFSELLSALNNVQKADSGIRLELANSLWLDQGFKIKPEYSQVVREKYFSEADIVEFDNSRSAAERINSWTAAHTQDKIRELFEPDAFDDLTRAVLVNAIYFKGTWKVPFDEKATKSGEFCLDSTRTVKTLFMTLSKSAFFGYHATEQYQLLALPYASEDMSLYIILPRMKDGLSSLEQQDVSVLLSSAISQIDFDNQIGVKLPKLRLETSYELKQVLNVLGIRHAFGQADFSGISDDSLYIEKVVHKAFVDVNEKGTEAAAATGIELHVRSVPQCVDFTADHPFLFAIRENTSGEILFLGRVVNPAVN